VAYRRSMAHAPLMGAILPEVRSTVRLSRTLPEPGACGGFFIARRNCSFDDVPAQAGTGDPDPGARADRRVPTCAGPAGGNEAMSRTPMAERTLEEFANCGATQSAAIEYIS
jgi:hypothetical protein